jgi:CheY-like chemotaxis protein
VDRKRGLVVGGPAVRRRALAHLLAREGYEAREVESATDAVRLLADLRPDVVVCDASLGQALADVLRTARERNPGVRCVVTREDAAAGGDALRGADAVLDRPVNLFELRRILER